MSSPVGFFGAVAAFFVLAISISTSSAQIKELSSLASCKNGASECKPWERNWQAPVVSADEDCRTLRLTGGITHGTAQTFREMYSACIRRLQDSGRADHIDLVINSQGGIVAEAMEIGRFVRSKALTAISGE